MNDLENKLNGYKTMIDELINSCSEAETKKIRAEADLSYLKKQETDLISNIEKIAQKPYDKIEEYIQAEMNKIDSAMNCLKKASVSPESEDVLNELVSIVETIKD